MNKNSITVVVLVAIIAFFMGGWLGRMTNTMKSYQLIAVSENQDVTVDQLQVIASETEIAILDLPNFTVRDKNINGMVNFTILVGEDVVAQYQHFTYFGEDGKLVTFANSDTANYHKRTIVLKGGHSKLGLLKGRIEIPRKNLPTLVEDIPLVFEELNSN
ncbi:hypothetical protein [Granulicatella seriolae]|uniref:DUF4230 domain-containing protein n=1 Tax=Granulicatella seriolae TaxID=2967226 RepID=A0ABT1WQJ2_9LACT|nr:hypothetical protein [Granulicatella seriolae]